MRTTLFLLLCLGMLLMGMRWLGVQVDYSLLGDLGRATGVIEPAIDKISPQPIPARSPPSNDEDRFNGTWENAKKKCTLNTRTHRETCIDKIDE